MGQAQGQKRAPKFKASKYEAPKPRRVTTRLKDAFQPVSALMKTNLIVLT